MLRPWLILTALGGLVVLVVLTLLLGDSAPRLEEKPVPKERPRVALGGGDAEMGIAVSDSANGGSATAVKRPLGFLLSGELPAGLPEFVPAGELQTGGVIEGPRSTAASGMDSPDGAKLAADDLVLGVSVNGAARAYPLRFLSASAQDVVNDELGGEQLVVTWNWRLRSGVVFHNPPGDLRLVFRSTGQTWKSDLVFQDLQTESYWSQSLGRCLRGQMFGSGLRGIPSMVCTWKAWVAAFPETTVCQLPQVGPPEAVTTSGAAVAAVRKTGQVLILCPDGELEISRGGLLEERVFNSQFGSHYAAVFYDDLADSVRALDPVQIKPLTFELRGLLYTLAGSDIAWNIINGKDANAVAGASSAEPLPPWLVLELPTELKPFRSPIGKPPGS